MRVMLVTLFVVLGFAVVIVAAQFLWQDATGKRIGQLDELVQPSATPRISAQEINSLPPPVARYLRAVLGPQPSDIAIARARWRGDFLLRPTPDGWRRFEAKQTYHTHPPGFVWDARIRMAPGLNVLVRDEFVRGAGSMRGAVLGIVPVVNVQGTPQIASGALQRYLGEAVWFPTALLPRNGVHWTPIDTSSARATITVQKTSISLDFHFGPDGLVESIYASARFRDVNGTAVPTPWDARVWQYVEHDGVRVPAMGEAAWLPLEGRLPYWRGELVDINYVRR
jgi:hypothetical protein